MRIFFYLILMWSSTAFSQIEIHPPVYREPEEVRELFKQLQKAFADDQIILVPFMENGKFGYLDYESLKVVVPPMADRLTLKNTAHKEGYIGEMDNYSYTFNEDGNLTMREMNYGPPQIREERPSQNWALPTDIGVKIIPKSENFKGFTYRKNEEGRIYVSTFSELYDSGNLNNPNLWPIEIDGEVYGIAEIRNPENWQTLAGIISPDGKPLKGFDFNFNKILPLTGLKESLGNWFLVQKRNSDDSKFHLINSKGEFLSEKILPQLDYNQYFIKTQMSTPYHIPLGQLNYVVNNNKIIDLYELKFIDIIPENYEILYLDFIYLKNLESEKVEVKRQNAKIFVVVKDEKGNWFYMDFNEKKYIPKKGKG